MDTTTPFNLLLDSQVIRQHITLGLYSLEVYTRSVCKVAGMSGVSYEGKGSSSEVIAGDKVGQNPSISTFLMSISDP